MKPLWEELQDLADDLLRWNKVDKAQLQTLRAAAVQMENWFVANTELREENCDALARIQQQDNALHALADVFHHAAKFARGETTLDAFGTGVIDKAPFLNAMAAHGRDSVGSPLPARKKRKAAPCPA